jgi:DNA polymerase III subunit epsilon
MLREIVLDTETTGTEARNGDRIIEIGCVELMNHCPTGRSFHAYINPERPVSAGALAVHGLSDAFLADKPLFSAIADEFEAFVGDARLVIHNAAFDVGFIDMEMGRLGRPAIRPERVVDTLTMARRKHPGGSNSLDALCARYGIDSSRRVKHGALLDAEILAEVYIELIGGRQAALGLGVGSGPGGRGGASSGKAAQRPGPPVSRLTLEERAAHAQFIAGLGANAVWRRYLPADSEETAT